LIIPEVFECPFNVCIGTKVRHLLIDELLDEFSLASKVRFGGKQIKDAPALIFRFIPFVFVQALLGFVQRRQETQDNPLGNQLHLPPPPRSRLLTAPRMTYGSGTIGSTRLIYRETTYEGTWKGLDTKAKFFKDLKILVD